MSRRRSNQDKIDKIFAWFEGAGLKVNARKTKLKAFGTQKRLADWKTINIVDGVIKVEDSFISLVVVLDNELSFRKQVSIFSRTCFFYLCQLYSLKRLLENPPLFSTLALFQSSGLQQFALAWLEGQTPKDFTEKSELFLQIHIPATSVL